MIEKLFRNPLALAGAFLLSALLGAGAFALIQAWLPGFGKNGQIERVVRGYILTHPEGRAAWLVKRLAPYEAYRTLMHRTTNALLNRGRA